MDNEIKMDEIICPSCNFANKSEAKFCQSCGISLEIKAQEPQREENEEIVENTCPKCKIAYPVGIKYCRSCGTYIENQAKEQKEKETNKENKKENLKNAKNSKKYAIIKSSIILFLSFILLICAFSPVVTYEIDDEYIENLEETIDVELTPFENIVFLFDSMKEYDEEGIKYDDLYEDFEDISGELEDIIWDNRGEDYIYLSYEEEEVVVEYAKTVARLALISDKISPSPSIVLGAVVSLLYIVFAFVFFGISIYNFIKALKGNGANLKLLTSLVCLAPFVIGFVYSVLCSGFENSTMGDSGMAMFFFIMGIFGLIAERFVFAEKKIKASKIVISACCILLCMITMSTAFGLVFNVEIRGKFVGSERIRGAETEFDSTFYQNLEINEKMLDELYEDSYNTDIERQVKNIIKEYTAAEVKNGKADAEVCGAVVLTMYRWMKDSCVYMSAIYYVGMLIALLAALAGWRCLSGFMDEEKNNRGGVKLFGLLSLIASFLFLVLNCVFIYMFNSMSDIAGTQRIFSMSLNGEVIETVIICSIIFVLSLFLEKNKKVEVAQAVKEVVAEPQEQPVEQETEQTAENE